MREKGITLIALIITIIVLLILAGVSIAFLTGDNGILIKAKTSKETSEVASVEEENKLNLCNTTMDKYTNGLLPELKIPELNLISGASVNCTYTGTLTFESNCAVLNAPGGWDVSLAYLTNLNFTQYKSLEINYAWIAGYEYSINLYNTTTGVISARLPGAGPSYNTSKSETIKYDLTESDKLNNNAIYFGASSLGGKIKIYSVKLY